MGSLGATESRNSPEVIWVRIRGEGHGLAALSRPDTLLSIGTPFRGKVAGTEDTLVAEQKWMQMDGHLVDRASCRLDGNG